MAITYKHHLWFGSQGYLNLDDGVTSRIRVKKLDNAVEVKNLDYDLPLAELSSITEEALQAIIDGLIASEEASIAADLAKSQIIVPEISPTIDAKVKKIKTRKKVAIA